MTARAELAGVLGLTLALACGAADAATDASPGAASTPAALTTAASVSARSQRAAMLAVTRAGDRLVVAGERGAVLLSDDGGSSWRQARVPVRVALTAVQFVDARRGWAVGHFGVVLRSEDGGETWTLQLDGARAAQLAQAAAKTDDARSAADQLVQDGPDKPLLAVHFSDAERGFVVGAYNLALKTTDGGKSWQYVGHELPNPRRLHLYGIAVSGQQMLVAGEQGLLMASSDGGDRFRAVEAPYPGSYFGVFTAGPGTFVAYGLRGTAFRSDDAGKSWQKAEVPTAASLSAGLALSDGQLVLASQAGDLLVSADQGRHFNRLPAPPMPLAAMGQTKDGRLVLGTLRGPVVLPLPR